MPNCKQFQIRVCLFTTVGSSHKKKEIRISPTYLTDHPQNFQKRLIKKKSMNKGIETSYILYTNCQKMPLLTAGKALMTNLTRIEHQQVLCRNQNYAECEHLPWTKGHLWLVCNCYRRDS